MATKLNAIKLKVPITNSYKLSTQPIYYKDPKDQKQYILIISKGNFKTRLIKYDIQNDSYINCKTINETIQGEFGYFVNKNRNKLYVVSTHRNGNVYT